ncbi:FG-GAP repeat protein [Sorangium sp. So ce834]|uniref:FG-GAP repeat protein n=1 Tax=Sorangium sp. So ce834 TaxID=3133321 RepID=UPI003F5F7714
MNGDGFADAVVAGTTYADNKGTVRVIFGSSSEPATWTLQPDISGSLPGDERRFGRALASGDINGDGYAALVIGAPGGGPDLIEPGSAYVYLGGPGGFDTVADAMFTGVQSASEFGASVASADFNGDGLSDITVGAPSASARPCRRSPARTADARGRTAARPGATGGARPYTFSSSSSLRLRHLRELPVSDVRRRTRTPVFLLTRARRGTTVCGGQCRVSRLYQDVCRCNRSDETRSSPGDRASPPCRNELELVDATSDSGENIGVIVIAG